MQLDRLKTLSVVALLALSAPALAQDTGGDTGTGDAATGTGDAGTGDAGAGTGDTGAGTGDAGAGTGDAAPGDAGTGLDMGEVVGNENAPGTTYTDEVFGDWERKCVRNPDGEDPCQLYQLLKDENGQPTAEISLLKLPDGQQAAAGATIVVPLQTLLTQQLTISIDGGQTKRYPFRFCTAIGCFSQIGLTGAEVASFKRGAKATVTITPAGAPDTKVNLPMSLTGFTAGYDALVAPPAN